MPRPFDSLLDAPRSPRAGRCDPRWAIESQMGPNALWLTEWLCQGLGLSGETRLPECRRLGMGWKLAREVPPEHQAALPDGIPGARLVLVERAGHNPHLEQPGATLRTIREFMADTASGNSEGSSVRGR